MVRLVFRPYTQVGRPICTSGPLRTSTRVSSGFALPRHSSPSFGSYRTRSRSTSPTERARRAGGAPGPERPGSHLDRKRSSLSLRHGVSSDPLTRACVRLLGPCFKTGRVGCRHRRRPLVSDVSHPHPATRGARVRTENSPTRLNSRRERGAPRKTQRALCPRPREAARYEQRRCKESNRSPIPPSPPALPSRPRAGRGAPPTEEMRSAEAEPDRDGVPRRRSPRTGTADRRPS